MEWVHELLKNDYFVWCAMAVIIFALTQVLKLPIKYFTKKISNERLRRIVNATILLIPFGLGILADFLYSTYYLHTAFTIITGLGYGTAGISLYGAVERFFKVKTNNPYESEAGKAVTELVGEISKDGKVDKNDTHAVKDFWKKIK
jgi:hypothetical protein